MKKFKLKKWYPSLDNDFEVGDIIYFDRPRGCYASINNRDISLRKREVENNPDFWELIEEKKPLFVTEDGVDIFDLCQTVYLIHPKTFIKQKSYLGCFSTNDLDNNKLFFHESNADEYVWKNKRVFSYEDIEKFQSGGEGTWWDVEAIAKGRSNE